MDDLTETGRVGEGARKVDIALRTRVGHQTEEARRPESADTETAAGTRGSGEEHDGPPRQEEGIAHPQTSRTRTVMTKPPNKGRPTP